MKYEYYFKKIPSGVEYIDVYRVLDLFQVYDPCIQHAIKKLLVAGLRGSKPKEKDIQEAIDSLLRFQEMKKEEDDSTLNLYNGMVKVTSDTININKTDTFTLEKFDNPTIQPLKIETLTLNDNIINSFYKGDTLVLNDKNTANAPQYNTLKYHKNNFEDNVTFNYRVT